MGGLTNWCKYNTNTSNSSSSSREFGIYSEKKNYDNYKRMKKRVQTLNYTFLVVFAGIIFLFVIIGASITMRKELSDVATEKSKTTIHQFLLPKVENLTRSPNNGPEFLPITNLTEDVMVLPEVDENYSTNNTEPTTEELTERSDYLGIVSADKTYQYPNHRYEPISTNQSIIERIMSENYNKGYQTPHPFRAFSTNRSEKDYPQLNNYRYPSGAKNIQDIIQYLTSDYRAGNNWKDNGKQPINPLKEDFNIKNMKPIGVENMFSTVKVPYEVFKALQERKRNQEALHQLGEPIKFKGIFISPINDEESSERPPEEQIIEKVKIEASTGFEVQNSTNTNTKPFETLKPSDLLDINYLANDERKNSISSVGPSTFAQPQFPKDSLYTKAIYHPFDSNLPPREIEKNWPKQNERVNTGRRPQGPPFSVMLDIYPMPSKTEPVAFNPHNTMTGEMFPQLKIKPPVVHLRPPSQLKQFNGKYHSNEGLKRINENRMLMKLNLFPRQDIATGQNQRFNELTKGQRKKGLGSITNKDDAGELHHDVTKIVPNRKYKTDQRFFNLAPESEGDDINFYNPRTDTRIGEVFQLNPPTPESPAVNATKVEDRTFSISPFHLVQKIRGEDWRSKVRKMLRQSQDYDEDEYYDDIDYDIDYETPEDSLNVGILGHKPGKPLKAKWKNDKGETIHAKYLTLNQWGWDRKDNEKEALYSKEIEDVDLNTS